MSEISVRRVAILGAGTTGGALTAHLTNLGFSVTLIDVTAASAAAGLEHVRSSLYLPERAGEIRTMGLEEGVSALGDADWVIEAVSERLDVKRSLYNGIAPHLQPDAIVTTTTASLPVAELAVGLPDGFAARFLGANFALPLHEHRLVEVRRGIDPRLAEEFGRFLSQSVARRVVHVPDGPGGIVARYGLWCLFLAVHVAEKLRLDIEDVEAITALGQSQGGIFSAVDRMGVDEIRDVAANLRERIPTDRGVRFFALPNSVVGLLARGWAGDKNGRGFFRREGRERLALDLTTMAYRQARDSSLPGLATGAGLPNLERLKAALSGRDEVGEYLREFLIVSLRYAEYLRDAMGVSVLDFDRSMEWGFGWERGPFALLDDLGIGAVRYYRDDTYWTGGGAYGPIERDEVCPRMEDCPVVDHAEGYTIHDLDDGIQALALHSGVLSPARVDAIIALLSNAKLDRFVLTSEGRDFPDLDLAFIAEAVRSDPIALDAYLGALQTVGELLQTRSAVAAISGRCVGPALGWALACPAIVAVADAEIGFNEGRLGFVPTARGSALLRAAHGGASRKLAEMAVTLSEGVVASNADLARSVGYLRAGDLTEHLPERLLTTAKERVRTITPVAILEFAPVEPTLVGMIDRLLNDRRGRGGLTEHDVTVGHRIRQILARTATYDECLERERKETIDLVSKALSSARIRHYIETGKALRN